MIREAAKRLQRVVLKKYPNLKKKLPTEPMFEKDHPDAEKLMLHYLAELGETIETLLPDHEGAVTEKLKIAKQIVEDERLLANNGIMSAIDPDARFGWKSNTKSFFGYKEHLAMTEEEIITAIEVTGGSVDDGKQLSKLLQESVETGIKVNEVIADTAYSGKDNLAELKVKGIQAVIPLSPIVHTGNAKAKTYSIRIVAEHYKEHMEFEQSDTFKSRIRRRPIIEHKNAELKRHHGLTRAKYRGLFGMRIQGYLTAFVVNAKRMVQLINKMQPSS